MNKRLIAFMATVVLAASGVAALLVHSGQAEERAFEGAELVDVLRVTDDVPAGASADELADAVELVSLPSAAVGDGALASLDPVAAAVTTGPLVPGEIVLEGKFATEATRAADRVPDGLQEVTVQVDAAPGLGGKIEEGDLVGVIANYGAPPEGESAFVAEKVLVLGIDSGFLDDGGAGASLVTLAVGGRDAVKISNAATFGTIWLSKQTDSSDKRTSGATTSEVAAR